MINTILLIKDSDIRHALSNDLKNDCHLVDYDEKYFHSGELEITIQSQHIDLIFVNPVIFGEHPSLLHEIRQKFQVEWVFINIEGALLHPLCYCQPVGFFSFPYNLQELQSCIYRIRKLIQLKDKTPIDIFRFRQWIQSLVDQQSLIGIPTTDGVELFNPKEIIRCEGLQRCTRIVTLEHSDIISSYNLGHFIELLNYPQFFSPHKSHLVNLDYVRSYKREGRIVLKDGADIPVSNKRRKDFLDYVYQFRQNA